jgi:protein phosphatase
MSAPDAIRAAVVMANHKIHNTGEDNPDFKGMGTTCSSLVITPRGAIAAQVGDSRTYRLRGHKYEQLSRDHSLVWEMMAQRGISENEAFVPKNIITRSLGPSPEVLVDLEGPFPLEPGDTFLICSDGLSGPVQDAEMGVILAALPPAEAVRVLVDLANLRGGPDNITVIVTRVGQVDPRWQSQSWSGGGGGSVNPLTWVAIGVFAMLAGLSWIGGQPLVAGVALILSFAAMFAAIWQRFSFGSAGGMTVSLSNLGTGPHRTYDATPTPELLNGFVSLIEPVCNTARQQNWQIDWHKFERLQAGSKQLVERGDYLGAIREQCRAIMFLMQEVRQQQER